MREQDLPAADRKVLRSLQVRSLASVTLLGLLGAATMLLFSVQVHEMETAASVLNLSGRQRMLSQRAALLAAELERASDNELGAELRAELMRIGAQIESAHNALASGRLLGLSDGLPAEIHAIYFEPPLPLDQQVRDYVGTLRAAADPGLDPPLSSVGLRSLVGIGLEERLLPSLEAASSAFEHYTTGRIVRLRWTTRVMAALNLATLWFLGQFVLWPMMQGLRRHLARLRQGEAEIQTTIEDSPIGLATVDPSYKILSANRALCKMLRYDRDEILRKTLVDLVHPEDFENRREELDGLLHGGTDRVALESRFLRHGGEIAYGQLHCGVLQIYRDEPQRLVVHFVDRTEQHRAAQEAQQNQERLTHITRLSTIGEMVAGLAHEINQPLTAIATYAEASRRLIRSDGADKSELSAVLKKVSAQAHRAGEVIQRLRLFIKKRHSRDELLDVSQVVSEAVELARADARFHDVPLQLQLEPSLPRVVVDAVQIEQVILNLVRNAVDSSLAAQQPEPILIGTRVGEPGFVEVSITDRGVGLSQAEHERLFEAFYSTKDSGLGMGLNISRSIIDSFGGRLWCESVEGEGATFRFSLPVAVGEEAAQTVPTVATT